MQTNRTIEAGDEFQKAGNFDEALLYYKKSLSFVEEWRKELECEECHKEAVKYSKELYEIEGLPKSTRLYIKSLQGLFRCQLKVGKTDEAGVYRLIAIAEAEKLYADTGAEKDKKLLEQLKK